MADDIRQSNGRVAGIQSVLINNLEKLGLTTKATQIGNAKGQPDDIMGRGSSRALEELVIRAQLYHNIPANQITRNYTNVAAGGYETDTLTMVEDYMRFKGVREREIQKFLDNQKSLDEFSPGHDHSVFDQSYVQGQINIDDITTPDAATPAKEIEPEPTPEADDEPKSELEAEIYEIQPGDNLTRIAHAHGVSVDELKQANEDYYPGITKPPHIIHAGRTLLIPGKMPAAEAQITTPEITLIVEDDTKKPAAATTEIPDSFEFRIMPERGDDNASLHFDSWYNGSEAQALLYVERNAGTISETLKADIEQSIADGMTMEQIRAGLNNGVVDGKYQSGPDPFITMDGTPPYKDIGPGEDAVQMRLNVLAVQELEKVEAELAANHTVPKIKMPVFKAPDQRTSAKEPVSLSDDKFTKLDPIDPLPMPEAYAIAIDDKGSIALTDASGTHIDALTGDEWQAVQKALGEAADNLATFQKSVLEKIDAWVAEDPTRSIDMIKASLEESINTPLSMPEGNLVRDVKNALDTRELKREQTALCEQFNSACNGDTSQPTHTAHYTTDPQAPGV